MFKILQEDGFKAMKKYLKEDPIAWQNFKKELSDLIISLLYLALIKIALSGEYKDYKKTMKDNPVMKYSEQLAVEIEKLCKSLDNKKDKLLTDNYRTLIILVSIHQQLV